MKKIKFEKCIVYHQWFYKYILSKIFVIWDGKIYITCIVKRVSIYWWVIHENDIHKPLSRSTLCRREGGKEASRLRGVGASTVCEVFLLLSKNIFKTIMANAKFF